MLEDSLEDDAVLIYFRLPVELNDALRALAVHKKMSKSDLVRQYLAEAVRKEGERK
mgnify:CR=1 FL=1